MATRVFAKVSDVLTECKDIPVNKELHRQILRSNLTAVFSDLTVIEHEYQAGSAKFNTLAYDTKRQRFAVVEYMRGENGLASRVIQYGDELKNEWHQNNILELCRSKLEKKSPRSWPGAYVIAMADHFSDRDKELVPQDKLNLPTELHIIQRPHPAIMVIEAVNTVQIATNEPELSIPEPPRKPGRPAKGTVGFFLSGRSNEIRGLGFKLEAALAELNLKPHIPESNQYVRFRHGKDTVCAVNVARGRLRIYYTIKRDGGVERPGFIYAVKHHLGKYASDIRSDEDILLTLRVVQAVYESKIGRGPRTGRKAPGISKPTKAPPAKKSSKPTAYTFVINGRQFKAASAISALKQIFEYLPQIDEQFLEKFDALKHGRTRRYVARDKSRLYPPGYAEAATYSYEIASAPGWWLGTNYSVKDIKKIATMAKETVRPEIGRTMSGNIFGTVPRASNKRRTTKRSRPKKRGATKTKGKTAKPARIKKSPKTKIQYTFHMNGRKFEARSAINALKQIFEYLPRIDPQFLEKFDALEHGKKRRYISRDRTKLYPNSSLAVSRRVMEIPSAPGWWMGTNYSVENIRHIAALAKETVSPKISRTMSGDIFGSDTNVSKYPKRTEVVTDDGYKIPPNENVENEFKSSFRHDYTAAEHEKNGNHDLAKKQRDLVMKKNFSHGLEWDIAKAVAGFSNSTVKRGRIWVGIRESKGRTPVVLGLREDMEKSKSKNMDDDFGNWITDLLKSCIRDYASFDNVKISYPRIRDKQICMLEITMASEPMYLFAKGNPSNTMFYKRSNLAPRTELLSGANLAKYMASRFKL